MFAERFYPIHPISMDMRLSAIGNDENQRLQASFCKQEMISPSTTTSASKKRKLEHTIPGEQERPKKLTVSNSSRTPSASSSVDSPSSPSRTTSKDKHANKKCRFEGCEKFYRSGSRFCVSHGGGRRCKVNDCTKSAQGSTDFCSAHGGGKRCQFQNCSKGARGRSEFCIAHGSQLKGIRNRKQHPSLKEIQAQKDPATGTTTSIPPSFPLIGSTPQFPAQIPIPNLVYAPMLPSMASPHMQHARSQLELSMFMNMINARTPQPQFYSSFPSPFGAGGGPTLVAYTDQTQSAAQREDSAGSQNL